MLTDKIVVGSVDVGDIDRFVLEAGIPFEFYDSTVTTREADYPQVRGFKLKSTGVAVCQLISKLNGHVYQDRMQWFMPLINALLVKIGATDVHLKSAKLNVSWPLGLEPDFIEIPHVDHTDGGYTCLIYLSDSDGDTRFFEEVDGELHLVKQVAYEKGKFVVFPTEMIHAGTAPSKKFRAALNLNFWRLSS